MEIEILKKLRDNPFAYPNDIEDRFQIQGLNFPEIQQLEQVWNNGNVFPKVLRELLFLAGVFCYICDYGPNDSQQEIQEWVREHMLDNNRVITRKFYAFDLYGGDTFLFIYLDGGDNPIIFEAKPYTEEEIWIKKIENLTIKNLIESRIERVKKGQNPY